MVFVAEALLLADADMVVARALVDRAVKMNSALEVGWDVAGNIRMQGGEYEDALARYERCLYLDRSRRADLRLADLAGRLVACDGSTEASGSQARFADRPNNPWAAANLIAALAHSGRLVEARAPWPSLIHGKQGY